MLRQRAAYIPVSPFQLLRFSSTHPTILICSPSPCSMLHVAHSSNLPLSPSLPCVILRFCLCLQPFPLLAVFLAGIASRTAHQPACPIISYSTRRAAGAYASPHPWIINLFIGLRLVCLRMPSHLRPKTHPRRCFPSTTENSTCPLPSLHCFPASVRI